MGWVPYARARARAASGGDAVPNPGLAEGSRGLRAEPAANALRADAFTRVNTGKLAARLGRGPTEGEL